MPPPLPDIALLNRITWGATESATARLRAMGRQQWLAWQLHPTDDDRLPPAAQAQIDALPISRLPMTALVADIAARRHAADQIADPAEKQLAQKAIQQAMNDLARQAATRQILRDLYAPAQLREQMTWFWFNHFNVHQYKSDIRPMLADYEEHAIRPYALGRFRDLLAATLRHPAMLRYLDNADNAVGHINENYAREIMELRTMGVGSGYTQHDVEELARCLTGVGIDARPENPHRLCGAPHKRRGLAGFADEIGPASWNDTVVVVISEFGRTFRENGNKGTDHGHGSIYWVMGGGIAGEQVRVEQATLFENRDLPVLTDYRALLGGLLRRIYGLDAARLDMVFPGARARDLALI